jgi:P27 family predicted phage terminase small subunit
MSILETWACASDVYRQAQGEIAKNRMLYTLPNGSVMQSPYLTIANRQSALMIKAASEMGFTPSSRSRISGIESAENEVNEWDRVT